MNIFFKQILTLSLLSFACSSSNGSAVQLSPNNTILQNLYALAFNQTATQNSTVAYISLLLGLNTSCTANVTQMLNSSSGNYTFFAPSDEAFKKIPGFPDFGSNFCSSCSGSNGSSGSSNSSGSNGSGGLISRIFQSENSSGSSSSCPQGCNDTSLSLNATSSQLMPCLPQILQYHLLNSSLNFNSTTFGFLNRSSYNLTVLPTMMNSSCLVNLYNSTNAMMNSTNGTSGSSNSSMMQNNQVLVFNISSISGNGTSGGSQNGEQGSNPFNVTILHGINSPANVTIFDIPSSNGVLHVIDALLIPPANMTDTINSTYSSISNESNGSSNSTSMMMPSFLNQTDLQMYANMSGITVFLPDSNNIGNSTENGSGSGGNSSQNFNLTNYIFPSLLYNNRSFEVIGNLSDGVFFQQNLTNLNGENVTILFGRNNAMLFNGSRVTESNILMKNGVLHLFDASNVVLPGGEESNGGNSTSASGLGRILRQMI